MVGVISKGPMLKNNHIFTHTSSISKNKLMCEMLLGWLTEMVAEIQ